MVHGHRLGGPGLLLGALSLGLHVGVEQLGRLLLGPWIATGTPSVPSKVAAPNGRSAESPRFLPYAKDFLAIES